MLDIVILSYVVLSLVLGGVAATIGVWVEPGTRLLGVILFVAVFWPLLAVAAILDRVR